MADVQTLPVRRVTTAYEQVADELRNLIVTGRLALGERLPAEPELCAMFGVSRSTVREALRVLCSQRLVVTTRGVQGGTFVATPEAGIISDYLTTSLGLLADSDAVDVDQLLEVRDLLEVPAAELAAQRRTEAQIEGLRAAVAAGREGNQLFHQRIVACCGNPLLGLVTRPVFEVLESRFLRDRAAQSFWTTVRHDHNDLLRAIEDGDAASAGEAMRTHLARLAATYRRIDRKART